PGFDYEKKAMEELMSDSYASPLSNHTSGGVTEAISNFVDALEPHLPWKPSNGIDDDNNLHVVLDDWCVSLQLEGASAVWAAIDMALQESMLTSGDTERNMVAVGETSYHGPPSTSAGARCPLWQKAYQVKYPVPNAAASQNIDEAELIERFEEFLDEHADRVGVILFEPQWGSSQAGYPWPKPLLKKYIGMARSRGIKIVTDEIMCGLGRHGNGSMFVSKDWDLDPDAITFGKAIGGGVYPISGAILKTGRHNLCQAGCTVMQSHTYAGSSVRALMTATEVLRELPNWLPSITKLGQEMTHIFGYLAKISDGLMIAHGQGLMWGCLFTTEGDMKDKEYRQRAIKCFRNHCEESGVLPYLVPAGGLMVSPHFDIDVGTLYEMGEKLENAILATMAEIGWSPLSSEEAKTAEFIVPDSSTEVMVFDPTKCQQELGDRKRPREDTTAANDASSSDEQDKATSSTSITTAASVTPASASAPAVPPYGSKKYWEDRYAQLKQDAADNKNGSNGDNATNNKEDPFHAWYFNFEELAPLILPLILGDGNAEEEVEEEMKSSEVKDEDGVLNKSGDQEGEASTSVSVQKSPEEDGTDAANVKVEDQEDEEEFEEIEDSDEEEDLEAELGSPTNRIGLAQGGPVSVVEIGCGDVPLGRDLIASILEMERHVNEDACNILEKVVCLDYSQNVIDAMKEAQRVEKVSKTKANRSFIPLIYEVADARELPYKDESFHLLLEKGTLDAMLSDCEGKGSENSRKIVAECARVLKKEGCMVVISHLNAHVPTGMQWLNDVIMPGLQAGAGGFAWSVEVHGNESDIPSEAENGDDDDSYPESPGPA
ncbi:MAG: hypothetical protein SGILL_005139, partial [Bacillariaceae sp.]